MFYSSVVSKKLDSGDTQSIVTVARSGSIKTVVVSPVVGNFADHYASLTDNFGVFEDEAAHVTLAVHLEMAPYWPLGGRYRINVVS